MLQSFCWLALTNALISDFKLAFIWSWTWVYFKQVSAPLCFLFFFLSPHTELEEVRSESLELFGAPAEPLGHVGHLVLFSTTVEGPGIFLEGRPEKKKHGPQFTPVGGLI